MRPSLVFPPAITPARPGLTRGARRGAPSRLLVGSLLACGLSVACGGNQDALKREISSLREQVTSLQGAQDHLEERLMAMEVQRSKARSERAAEDAEEPEQDERPRLKVVRLSPSDSDVGHDEADEAPLGSSAAAR
ncbi:MAG: hypothetical protein KIT72_02145 [Polyangiaceae bacterium]|nr:hypothetical protein [Polyangiaceae bacterium]MCW5789198.1 hypothetical protein [Polyangiaceae bacterium]